MAILLFSRGRGFSGCTKSGWARSSPENKKGRSALFRRPPYVEIDFRTRLRRVSRDKRVLEPLSAAAEAAAASAPARAAAEAAAAARPIRAGLSFVDFDGPALEVPAVQSGDGLFGLVPVRHLNEAETARLTRRLVRDDGGLLDRPERLEGVAEVALGRGERKVTDINVQKTSPSTMDRSGSVTRTVHEDKKYDPISRLPLFNQRKIKIPGDVLLSHSAPQQYHRHPRA